jgi:hypothetical protein
MAERTAGEQEFINQKTRELMVGWCEKQLQYGKAHLGHCLGIGVDTNNGTVTSVFDIYWAFAKEKKWISADGERVLSAGWDTAARFLKR